MQATTGLPPINAGQSFVAPFIVLEEHGIPCTLSPHWIHLTVPFVGGAVGGKVVGCGVGPWVPVVGAAEGAVGDCVG